MTSRIDIIGTNGNDGEHYEKPFLALYTCGHSRPCSQHDPVSYDCTQAGCSGKIENFYPNAKAVKPDTANPTMADRYQRYYKDVRHLDAVDVYRVHRLFDVTDNEIHHASKKLLLCGVRTGGKPARKEIEEARDTLNRWLEIQDEDERA